MALQVWLPLDGRIQEPDTFLATNNEEYILTADGYFVGISGGVPVNNGLDDTEFTVNSIHYGSQIVLVDDEFDTIQTSDGCDILVTGMDLTEGKIAATALQMHDTDIRFTVDDLVGADTFSVAFWYKAVSDSSISTNWNKVLTFYTNNEDGTDGSMFRFESSYGSNYKTTFALSVHNNPSQSLGSIGHEIIALKDEWHHVIFTHSPELNSTYLDGELVRTGAGAAGTLTGLVRIAGKVGGTDPYGLMNDLRIYDHELSLKEVKDISKGLIAHYPLNDKIGGENLILNSDMQEFGDSFVSGSTYHWSSWATATDRSLVEIYGKKWLHYKSPDVGKYGGFNQDNNNNGDVIRIKPNTYYTVSATWFASEPITCCFWFHMRSSEGGANLSQPNYTFDVTTTPKRYFYKFNSGSNADYTINRFNLMMGCYRHTVADVDVYFTDVKMEEGTVETQWIPNSHDDEYAELGLDENTIYDCSGYEHNLTLTSGTSTNIEVDPDTPRYGIATSFNRVSKYGAYVFTGKTFTIALWLKQNALYNWARYVGLKYSNNDYIGFCDGSREASVGFHIYKDVDGTKTALRDGYISGWTIGEWFHAAAVVDGTSCVFYKDGEARSTVTMKYEASELTRLLTLNALGDNNSSSGDHSMSDVRIYATALSAEEIKELYEVSASVDQNGNTWAYELVEE